jgi:hypothetical protein
MTAQRKWKDTAAKAPPALTTLPASASSAQILGVLRREGVVVVERAAAYAELIRIKDELDPWFEAAFKGTGPFFGRSTRRFGGLFAKARSTADLALHPAILGAIESLLLGPHSDTIEMNLSQAIGIEPGEKAQYLHRDETLWPFKCPFEIMANVMWALDDFTEENGATRLIPGSHLWPRDRLPRPGEALTARAPAGSAVVWLGGVLHGGGANRSKSLRRGVVMSYRLGWLAPAERLLLSTPPAVARQLPVKLQKLLGYQIHKPNLGWVEGQDPILWLNGKIGDLAPCGDNLTAEQEAGLDALLKEPPAEMMGYIR